PHRDAIDHERRRVVQEALSPEHMQDPPRQAQPTENRRGRRGIRRGDDGAERDGGGDRETTQPPADPRNRCRGETDGHADGGRGRDYVLPEVARRRVERRVQQDGSDEERERQVGLDLELGARRDEGQRGAGNREERRIRDPDTPRDTGQDHRSEEERQRRFEERHVRSLERPAHSREPGRRGRRWRGRPADLAEDVVASQRGSLPLCSRATLAECLTTASLVTSMSAGTKRRAARWVTTGTARTA